MGHHRAARRSVVHRGRLGALVGAVALTLVIGVSGIVTQLSSGPASADDLVADAVEPALLAAALPEVEPPAEPEEPAADADPALPADSGEGRRVVFSEGDQRVWLVADDGAVERTYLVSGSKHDNLDPGTYDVTSRSRHATAFDYSGTMEFFVQFTTGRTAPIGFHSVPKDNAGDLEQTKEQLGTALSAGCVRQWRDDAVALWTFADIGTTVVVTA
ncbi:L,D-transpeptidase [Aeromicrobium sp. CF4.19]|uniref:L,D-transpeptidase n=1 Tax=Aeromicrobium sp. CF4.19 TaxID=3373082 RepID=UPI003EE4B8F4